LSKVMDTYEKYREPLLYVIVGALTTAVNFVVYFICADVMNISVLVSEGIGWVCSVSFAYITDKIVVFRSKSLNIGTLLKEMAEFVGARLVSGVMDIALFYLLVTVLGFHDYLSKIFINVLVVVINYLFSKFVIFKKPKNT